MCYFSSKAQKITISRGFNLISNSVLQTYIANQYIITLYFSNNNNNNNNNNKNNKCLHFS